MSREPIPFVEQHCTVGGCHCGAWSEWFQACEDTDPNAIDEDRDPAPLSEWPFDPLGCERPDICPMYRLSKDASHDD
jgi:hypothetical protein